MTGESERKKPGRKPGEHKQFPEQHAARFTAEGMRRLRALATRWGESEAGAIRRAIDEAAQREGVG